MGAVQSVEASPSSAPPCKGARGASSDEIVATCPVPVEQRSSAVYNVYNQRVDNIASASDPYSAITGQIVDPRNNMPLVANQQPAPGQRELLSTNRVRSTIPKGGTDSTWEYPSPQMFYNGARAFNFSCIIVTYMVT
jgi:cytochrome c heme-lyase